LHQPPRCERLISWPAHRTSRACSTRSTRTTSTRSWSSSRRTASSTRLADRRPAPGGRRFVGKREVREGFQARIDGIPDVVWDGARHFADGDRGASEWTIRGTQSDGEPIEVRGCDLFEFRDGKVSRKDSFWKIVP
jgi:hypothetical protein